MRHHHLESVNGSLAPRLSELFFGFDGDDPRDGTVVLRDEKAFPDLDATDQF
ncbi:MAG: hypothetical protein AAFV36_01515 [Myxococcota bacterium]